MSKRENHHVNFKKIQRQVFNVPWNKGIYDETKISLEKRVHNKITKQVPYLGVPMAYTLGEIDQELLREQIKEDESEED